MAYAITNEDVHQYKDNIMIDEKNRLASFKKWSFKTGNCTKEQMASAGFYKCNIKGEIDSVRCFVCFKSLDGWEKDDDPFDEHLRHSPNCSFAKLKSPQQELVLTDWITILMERNTNLHKLRLQHKIDQLSSTFNEIKDLIEEEK